MNWRDSIEQSSEVLGGKPCIKGTRVSVELILERLPVGRKKKSSRPFLHCLPKESR